MAPTQVVTALGAIAHDHRLAIYRMLVEKGPDGVPAGMIAARLDIPSSSLTFHLQQMQAAGLVTRRRLGRQLLYAADSAAMNAIVGYLTENCCGNRNRESCAPACAPAPIAAKLGGRPKRRSA